MAWTTMGWLLVLAVVLLAATTTPVAAARHHHHHRAGFEKIFDVQEADRVERLPGLPAEVGFRHFSGFVTVNETHGRALFYWFHEATHGANFKSTLIGNADLDDEAGDRGTVDYAWHHAIISDELYASINNHCNFSADSVTPACVRDFDAFYAATDGLDVYSLYTPLCTTNGTMAFSNAIAAAGRRLRPTPSNNLRRGLRHNGYDPCRAQYAAEYLNRRDVQEALHANVSGAIPCRWAECSDPLFQHWNWDDSPASMLPVIRKMIDAGLRVWVYSGDTDSVVPITSTRYALRKLGLTTVKQWREWFTSDQVGGYTVIYHGLTFVTVHGAGHMVPTITPVQARQLFAHFLAGKELPHKPVVA